jgi:hypothetical protein
MGFRDTAGSSSGTLREGAKAPNTRLYMYPYVLGAHNLVRWIVLLTGIVAVALAWRGWLGRRQWTNTEARATRAFVGALDLQFLFGLLLYAVFSPLTRQGFSDMGAAMSDAPVRYFLLEHPVIMIAAIAAAHIGAVQVRKASTDAERFQRASILLGLSFAAIVGFIPWARPLVPSF